MALQLSFETASGFTAPDAYHKTQSLRVTKTAGGDFKMRIMVSTFLDAAAREAGKPPLATRSYAMDYDIETSNNAFVDGYIYLKTLPEYDGAIDV